MISIWEKDSFYGDCDILIVGGGLLGMWTALEMIQAKPNLKITIAEALAVPALASSRNAGFACFGSPSELFADSEKLGESDMLSIVEMRYKGIQKIRKTFGDSSIDLDQSGGFEVYPELEGWNGEYLSEKLVWLNQGLRGITGLKETYTDCSSNMSEMGLSGFSSMAGNAIEGGLHSGKLVAALWQKVISAGILYLSNHRVEWVEPQSSQYHQAKLQAAQHSVEVTAKQVIWTTNAGLTLKSLPVKVSPARGQIILSPPMDHLHLKGTFHFDEGFYYFRNLGNRLLLGGGRNAAFGEEDTLDDSPTEKIKRVLESFVEKHLPQVAPLLGLPGWMHWAGIMGMSESKRPMITEIRSGEWVALACNGMGVALSPIVAEKLKERVLEYLG